MVKQIKLTDALIEGYIAADVEMTKTTKKYQKMLGDDEPDPKLRAEVQAAFDTIASKHGFKNHEHYSSVAENIALIIGCIDPSSGDFTDPVDEIRKEIEQVKVDKSITGSDRKTMLKDLNEALKDTQPIKFEENVRLVKRFRKKLYALVW